MSGMPVELVGRQVAYQGFFRLDKVTVRHGLFNGGMSKPIVREIFVKPPAAGVLPWDPVTGEVLLIEQFRAAAMDESSAWLLEIIAGYIEPGESAEAMARREALEEANVELSHVEHVLDFMLSPGGSNERFSLFVAAADLSRAGGVHGLPEEGEDIRVNVMSLDQAWQAVLNGRVNNSPAIIAIQWLMMHRDRLRARWGS